MPPAANTYHICLSYADAPIAWDPYDESEPDAPLYLSRVLQALEERIGACGLTFYVTWKLDALPSYGDHVVAVVLGDEGARVPRYSHRVLATFKCYGTRPSLGCRPLRRPSYYSLLLTVKYLRERARHLPGSARRALAGAGRRLRRGTPLPPIFDFPLGYGNQLELPVVDVHRRRSDVFFAGSMRHGAYPWWSASRWIQSPKNVSRRRMLDAVDRLARSGRIRVDASVASTFALNAIRYGAADGEQILDAEAYSRRMMDAKICVVPRGTSAETFRFFEALRYGCVLVAEPLPRRWFYDGSPAVTVEDWEELDGVVARLLADPALLARRSREARAWWETKCSERAVGAFMADRLLRLLGRAEGGLPERNLDVPTYANGAA